MKKLLLVSVALISLASCERKRCWECTSFPDNPDIADTAYTPRNEELCDLTENQIEAHVRSNQGIIINGIKQKVVCKKED